MRQLAQLSNADRFGTFFGLANANFTKSLAQTFNKQALTYGFGSYVHLPNTVGYDPFGGVLYMNGRKKRFRSNNYLNSNPFNDDLGSLPFLLVALGF